MIAPGNSGDNPQLTAAIIEEIQQAPARRITFKRFMEMALYYPGEGYYTHRGGLIGARGDFFTSPHLSPVFGELVSRQVVEFWERLERPASFRVVEIGAGQGLLAGDILQNLCENEPLWSALSYDIIELSETLRQAQRRRLEALPGSAGWLAKVNWRELDEFRPGEVTGCFVSNELFDAFPVHLFTIEAGRLFEIYVKYSPESGGFVEESGPLSDPAIAAYFEWLGLDLSAYQAGYRSEINLAALAQLEKMARALGRGYILTIDYGYPAAQRYHPLRSSGSLQCYSQHRVHSNPYVNTGRQDITTHVDFTALSKRGEELGLRTEGLTKQALFLAGLGLGDKLAALTSPANRARSELSPRQQLAEYEALQRLANPAGLGNFGVLIQSRGLPPGGPALAGLALVL